MKPHLLDTGVLIVAATVAVILVIATEPGTRSVALHVYVIAVGTLVMGLVVAAARAALPRRTRSPFTEALARDGEYGPARPDQLARVEREVTLGVATAYDLHAKLLPELREIARCRLERAGKRPSPETLGRWWELLRPDRPVPDDKFAPGIPEADLRALVADLEQLR
jgi:hypothetical protein